KPKHIYQCTAKLFTGQIPKYSVQPIITILSRESNKSLKNQSMKSNKKTIIITIIALLVVTLVTYGFLSRGSDSVIEVKTTTAQKGEVTKLVTATGTVQPLTEVEVGTQVSGKVSKIYVD